MSSELSLSPVVTEYVAIDSQWTQREITLSAQGEAVLLSDDMSATKTASLFATVYDISNEAVLQLSDGRLILLFDHQSKEVLRPQEVDMMIWTEIVRVKDKSMFVQDIACPSPEITINLIELWDEVKKYSDSVTRTKFFIKSLFHALVPAITVCIQGEIPNLPLLSALYVVRPYGHTIVFKDAKNTRITLFSNL